MSSMTYKQAAMLVLLMDDELFTCLYDVMVVVVVVVVFVVSLVVVIVVSWCCCCCCCCCSTSSSCCCCCCSIGCSIGVGCCFAIVVVVDSWCTSLVVAVSSGLSLVNGADAGLSSSSFSRVSRVVWKPSWLERRWNALDGDEIVVRSSSWLSPLTLFLFLLKVANAIMEAFWTLSCRRWPY